MDHVPFLRPTFPPVAEIADDYAGIVARGTFSNRGPLERAFAEALGAWIGPAAASPVSSCTTGLEMAVRALFRRGRRRALVASFTFAAGPLALHKSGYEPVFIDVEPQTWQPSATSAARYLAEHHTELGGILLTATFGVANRDIGDWEELAARYELPLVIDSAAGFGSTYESGERLGARGLCEVFSLHATKTLAVGEGGVLTSRNPELISRFDRLKNFGLDGDAGAIEPGTNAKMTELSAAIGLRQLESLPRRLALRRTALRRYIDGLTPLGIGFQPGADRSALPFVSALLPTAAKRDAARNSLAAIGVETRAYYNPVSHRHPLFAGCDSCSGTSATDDLAGRILSLPVADDLAPGVIDRITVALAGAIRG